MKFEIIEGMSNNEIIDLYDDIIDKGYDIACWCSCNGSASVDVLYATSCGAPGEVYYSADCQPSCLTHCKSKASGNWSCRCTSNYMGSVQCYK